MYERNLLYFTNIRGGRLPDVRRRSLSVLLSLFPRKTVKQPAQSFLVGFALAPVTKVGHVHIVVQPPGPGAPGTMYAVIKPNGQQDTRPPVMILFPLTPILFYQGQLDLFPDFLARQRVFRAYNHDAIRTSDPFFDPLAIKFSGPQIFRMRSLAPAASTACR